MLKNEWPHGIGVALGADRKLSRGRAYLTTRSRPVRIVAIAALDQSHVHAMTIRPGKLSLLGRVASETKLGLRLHQHEVNVGGFMRAVTSGAADAVGQVLGLGEILCLQAGLMALSADGRCLGRAQCLEANDLGDVATAIDVGLRRTMATLASV